MRHEARSESLGGLEVQLVEQVPDPELTLVLLHGFGAGADDLVPFTREIDVGGARYLFPQGPLALARMFGGGHAWWLFDFGRLERASRSGQLDDIAAHEPAGLAEARERLEAMLSAAASRLGVRRRELVVGGFSQGAIVSLDWALHAAEPPRALILLSPMLVSLSEWRFRFRRLAGVPVFVSHGRRDQVLPFALADQLRRELDAAGARVTWAPFDGAHEVSGEILPELERFTLDLRARARGGRELR